MERFKEQVRSLSPSNLHISHTCGNGRAAGKKDTQVCCNPDHLEIRTKKYNEEQVHCHYFLNRSDKDRQRFFNSGLCNHDPKCF